MHLYNKFSEKNHNDIFNLFDSNELAKLSFMPFWCQGMCYNCCNVDHQHKHILLMWAIISKEYCIGGLYDPMIQDSL